MYNPFTLQGKTILVTGASSGIGRAIAIECSKMGANLIITGRNEKRLSETLKFLFKENNTTHLSYIADLTKEEEVDNLIENIPVIEGLVHSAGIATHMPFQFIKEEYLKNMFDVNFFSGTLLSTKLVKTRKLNRNSSVVFISSTTGIINSYVGGASYAASKGAINGLIKGMVVDLAARKIRVNSVMPAMVDTGIMDHGTLSQEQFEKDEKRYPLKRYGKPEEVAYAVIYLLSDASSWTTGSNLLLDGGITSLY